MAKLTKADAARQLGIARSTLYKLIDQGKVSPIPDGLIDQAELVRLAAFVDTFTGRPRTYEDTREIPALRHTETSYERPRTDDREHGETGVRERLQTSADALVDILREQIQVLRDDLQEACQAAQEARQATQERERDYREQIARLTTMLDQAHQQNQRLLDLPRPAPQASPQDARGAPPARRRPESPLPPQRSPQGQPEAQGGDTRGDMRQRIVALLQDHPEGLTPAKMRAQLGVDKSLADTCLGMLRYGLAQRVGRGRYVAAAPSRNDR